MKMVKCLPVFEYFTVFLKNKNFISKIRWSKVTDYAALKIRIIDTNHHNFKAGFCIVRKSSIPSTKLVNAAKMVTRLCHKKGKA